MTSQVRNKLISESSQKRNISLILGILFILGFVIPIYQNWKISQKIKVTSQVRTTIHDISSYCQFYNDSLKYNNNSQDEVIKHIIPSILKSEISKGLNDKVNHYDRFKQIKGMDLFWDSLIRFYKQNNVDINKSNLYNSYSNLIDNIAHEENISKVLISGSELLPYERFLHFGEAKYQALELEADDIEIDEATDEEIENFYAKNINSIFRKNATCNFRYAVINNNDVTNRPRPDSISLNEVKEYLRKHDEIWEVGARRCFRFLAMEKNKNYSLQSYQNEDFSNLNSRISLETRDSLPIEFADKLFNLKAGEIATNLEYDGTRYAIQYLFEIPKIRRSLDQALNIAKLRCYNEKVDKQKKDIIESLRIMPKSYPKITKETINELFSSVNWELEWKLPNKKEIEFETIKELFVANEFPKSSLFYLNKLFEDKLHKSQDNEDDEILDTEEKYYFINENNNLIVEIYNITQGYVEPIAKVREYISRIIFEQKQKDKLIDMLRNLSKKLIVKDKEDRDLMGADKKCDLLSILVASNKIDNNSNISNKYINNGDESIDYELKQSKIINALQIPKKDKCIYALINDIYSENGNWQLIKYEGKEIENHTKKSLENEEILELTEEKKNDFYSTEENQLLLNLMHIWLIKANNVDELKEESENLYKIIEKYSFSKS